MHVDRSRLSLAINGIATNCGVTFRDDRAVRIEHDGKCLQVSQYSPVTAPSFKEFILLCRAGGGIILTRQEDEGQVCLQMFSSYQDFLVMTLYSIPYETSFHKRNRISSRAVR